MAPLVGACGPFSPPQDDAPLVVLVSWDTTRADALGCYADLAHWGAGLPAAGRPAAQTPVVDALCAGGQRFDWALAHAPTTLNSHTSLLTGLDPHQHSVPRNGFPVPPGLPLLSERFAAAGWDTIGVVGASVLAADMGLARGFRVYDDTTPTRVRKRHERSAEDVVAAVLDHVDDREPGAPLFVFAHFFDAHSPWETPPASVGLGEPGYDGPVDGSAAGIEALAQAVRQGTADPADLRSMRRHYLAEVARMDAALGALLDGLSRRKTGDRLVVVVGDHGEALGTPRRRPVGHGVDVDLEVVHVPLVFHGTGRFALPPGRQPGVVGLVDVAPTVAALAGLAPLGQGRDLGPLFAGGAVDAAVVFAEATKPFVHEDPAGWNNRAFEKGAAGDGLYLSESPWEGVRQVQRLQADSRPVALSQRSEAEARARLSAALQSWTDAAPPHRAVELSDETRAALEALGYLDPAP